MNHVADQRPGEPADGDRRNGDSRGAGRIGGCLAPLVVLVVALTGAAVLYLTRETPEAERPGERVLVVRTEPVHRAIHRLDVHARGQVLAARRTVVVPQVRGRIVELGPNLVPGSRVSQGELLVRIDPADYHLAVQRAEATLAEAEGELALEEGRQQVAAEEWRRFREGAPDPAAADSPLALREPQLRVIEARVRAGRAAVEQARLDLARTEVRAPFDGLVLREGGALGQLAGPEQEIAEIVASGQARVQTLVRFDEVDAIAIPGVNAQRGSRVQVRQDVGNGERSWSGRVQSLLGDVQPQGLMARVLVVVDDPFAGDGARGAMPLLLDTPVRVVIEGRHQDALVEVPRRALRADDRVFVMTDDERLSVRQPDIVWRLPHAVLARAGIEHGDRVIVSPIETAVEGLRLREEQDR